MFNVRDQTRYPKPTITLTGTSNLLHVATKTCSIARELQLYAIQHFHHYLVSLLDNLAFFNSTKCKFSRDRSDTPLRYPNIDYTKQVPIRRVIIWSSHWSTNNHVLYCNTINLILSFKCDILESMGSLD